MKGHDVAEKIIAIGFGILLAAAMVSAEERIDRHALVTRHNITWNEVGGLLPLGNGEFCFGADATGLQTFAGNSMSHWGWHSFPLPEDWTAGKKRCGWAGTSTKTGTWNARSTR